MYCIVYGRMWGAESTTPGLESENGDLLEMSITRTSKVGIDKKIRVSWRIQKVRSFGLSSNKTLFAKETVVINTELRKLTWCSSVHQAGRR